MLDIFKFLCVIVSVLIQPLYGSYDLEESYEKVNYDLCLLSYEESWDPKIQTITCILQPESSEETNDERKLATIQFSIVKLSQSDYIELEGNNTNNTDVLNASTLLEPNDGVLLSNFEETSFSRLEETSYTQSNIHIHAENIPRYMHIEQIHQAINTVCVTSSGYMPPMVPIIFSVGNQEELFKDVHNTQKGNDKNTNQQPIESNSLCLLKVIKKLVKYYVANWHFSPVAFGFAAIIEILIDKKLKEGLVDYVNEPTKKLYGNCFIEILADTQELLDDAKNQGVMRFRHDIAKTRASDIMKDFNETSYKKIGFKSSGLFLRVKSLCECQFCKADGKPAQHNLREKRVEVFLPIKQLRRDISKLLLYDLSKRLHAKVFVSGYFLKINTLFNNTSVPSCTACPKIETSNSQSVTVVVVNAVTYTTGIISLPVMAYTFYKIKKCIGF